MSSEDNRSQTNLLLMCRFHAEVIDTSPDDFPSEALREWKATAEQGGGVQPPITEEETEHILQMVISQEMTINAEIITLGGGLGGGGGAIGPGAIGGKGGDITFPELQPPTRSPSLHEDVSETLGTGYSDGYDGQPGGPSTLYLNNELIAVTGGGGGGPAGTGLRTTSDRIAISAIVLANYIEHRDGFLYLVGGAWDRFTTNGFPEEIAFAVELIFEAGNVPVGEYTVHVEAFDPDGNRIGIASFPLTIVTSGAILRIPRFVHLPVRLEMAGPHTISVRSDLSELGSIGLMVMQRE